MASSFTIKFTFPMRGSIEYDTLASLEVVPLGKVNLTLSALLDVLVNIITSPASYMHTHNAEIAV